MVSSGDTNVLYISMVSDWHMCNNNAIVYLSDLVSKFYATKFLLELFPVFNHITTDEILFSGAFKYSICLFPYYHSGKQ